MKTKTSFLIIAATYAGLAIALGVFCPRPLPGQVKPPKFEVDPSWPKPLPDRWVTGPVGGVCVDAQDHVFILNRREYLADREVNAGHEAPPVIEFDPDGNVVGSWGDPDVVPKYLHGCFVDRENNVWLTGARDGIVQKYTHDGSKLLLQIGKSGVFDSSDGTIKGKPLNSSRTLLDQPAGVAVDRSNGDIYVADGEIASGNHRLAVFDRSGRFLRQWGLQRTKAEAEAAHGFEPVLHCVAISNDGLVYVCDRRADRVQVFDKMGKFQKNIPINPDPRGQYQTATKQRPDEWGPGWAGYRDPNLTETFHRPDVWGTGWIGFSPDQAQKFMYVMYEHNEQVNVLDRASGRILSSFGRAGHQAGEFTYGEMLAVDSKGNVYVAETGWGERVQKFKVVSNQ